MWAVASPAERPVSCLTTAQLLERTKSGGVRARELAPVGFALHHFTDIIIGRDVMSHVELHQATTILTKQLQRCLAANDWLQGVQTLVTDPDRPALGDGRTAQQACGVAWQAVLDVAKQRSDLETHEAARYGDTAILMLAALHGCGTDTLWWGTASWRLRVYDWTARHSVGARTRSMLTASPEHVDQETLAAVIADSEPVGLSGPR